MSPAFPVADGDASASLGAPPASTSAAAVDDPLAIAPWASQIGTSFYASMIFRVLYFLLILPGFFMIAVWMRLWVVVTVAFVGLIFANLFSQVTRMVDRFPKIKSVGPLGHALDFVVNLRDHYREHKPSWFIYYTFFPIAVPIASIFRRVSRAEFKIWGKTFLVLIVGDVASAAGGYMSTYPPYLTPIDALKFVAAHIALSVFLSIVVLMPIMTTAFTLSLSGRTRSLRVISVLSFVLMGLATFLGIRITKNQISFNSLLLIQERMEKPDFRIEIETNSEILVTFLAVHSKPAVWAKAPDQLVLEPVYTEKFQSMISSVALNDEPKAFHVVHFRVSPGGPLVFGTLYVSGKEATVLHLEDLTTHELANWGAMPEALRDRLKEVFAKSGLKLKEQMICDDPKTKSPIPKCAPNER